MKNAVSAIICLIPIMCFSQNTIYNVLGGDKCHSHSEEDKEVFCQNKIQKQYPGLKSVYDMTYFWHGGEVRRYYSRDVNRAKYGADFMEHDIYMYYDTTPKISFLSRGNTCFLHLNKTQKDTNYAPKNLWLGGHYDVPIYTYDTFGRAQMATYETH